MNNKKVKMEPCLAWTCPDCQHKNIYFAKTITDPEDIAEIKEMMGPDTPETEEFVEFPLKVACHKCEEVFETQLPEDTMGFGY